MGERGVGRAEVRVERWAMKKREKRVVMGEEGSIFFCWGFGGWGVDGLLVMCVAVAGAVAGLRGGFGG